MDELITYFLFGVIVFLILFIIIIYFIIRIRKALKKVEKHKKPSSFKCLDGHIVKSKGELIIDNQLSRLDIQHDYEKNIEIHGNIIKTDWYLPKYNIYIEYWGYYGKEYEKRKEEKIKLYKKGRFKLISIEDMMFTDIYTNLDNEFKNFLNLEEIEKHCPNCGIKLDDRF